MQMKAMGAFECISRERLVLLPDDVSSIAVQSGGLVLRTEAIVWPETIAANSGHELVHKRPGDDIASLEPSWIRGRESLHPPMAPKHRDPTYWGMRDLSIPYLKKSEEWMLAPMHSIIK
jgi:hypothetical protein